MIDNLYFEPPDSTRKQVGFWVLLVLSATIATLAILADSTAVVIGAMLVAPLMTPILGVSSGIVNRRVLGPLIVMVPLAFTSEGILTSVSRQSSAQAVTEEWLGEQSNLRLNKVEVRHNEVDIVITGEGDIPSVSRLNEDLSESFGTRTIAVVEYFPSQRRTAENQA